MRNARETEEPERRTYTGAWRQGVSVYTAVRGQHGPDVWSAVCEQNESDVRARPRRTPLESDLRARPRRRTPLESDARVRLRRTPPEPDRGGGLHWSQMPE